MTQRKSFLLISVPALALALSWGCSDDTVNIGGNAASGGASSGGANSKLGGAGPSGGKAVGGVGGSVSGAAGMAGAPVAAVGGVGAVLGAGGTPSPETGGGAGVMQTNSGGMAGSAGHAGHAGSEQGGQGGAVSEVAKTCGGQCVGDDDCKESGFPSGYSCDPTSKRCVKPTEVCQAHSDCVAFATDWFFACSADVPCLLPGQECVEAGGVGRCADPPIGDSCFLGLSVVSVPRFGAAGSVDVCASTAGRCEAGRCSVSCATTGCLSGNGTSCNAQTGLCECSQSSECTGRVGSVCNPSTHHCGCGSSTDCTNQFDNVTTVCE